MSKQSAQLERYGGGETDDYSSDSDVYSDNIYPKVDQRIAVTMVPITNQIMKQILL
ncbi:1335_t:CDS:1, partial [Paraglomus occultum]